MRIFQLSLFKDESKKKLYKETILYLFLEQVLPFNILTKKLKLLYSENNWVSVVFKGMHNSDRVYSEIKICLMKFEDITYTYISY